MKKIQIICIIITLSVVALLFTGCDFNVPISGGQQDTSNTLLVGNRLARNQPTPTDIDYSLERFNLGRRAYWVNGQREKANMLPCPVQKPLGYIALVTESGAVLGTFIVDGKVSSLRSYLTPESELYSARTSSTGISDANAWLPDIDGSFGDNSDGIFFFTPDGNYIEWKGGYLYSDIPMRVESTVIKFKEVK